MTQRRPALALVALALAACGPSDGDASSRVPLGIEIRGLAATDIGQIQLTVLSHAVSYNCLDLQTTCLRGKVLKNDGTPIADLVQLKDEKGVAHNSLRFTVDGTAVTSTAGQTFELRMPPGQNYLVVAEVLSKDSPAAKLLASGCNLVGTVEGGDNRAVVVNTTALAAPADCKVEID